MADATASLCLKNRRRNSRHWLSGLPSSANSMPTSPSWTAASSRASSSAISTSASLATMPLPAPSRTGSSSRKTIRPSVPDARVEDAVQDVGQQVEGDDERGDHDHPRQHDGGVALDDGVD